MISRCLTLTLSQEKDAAIHPNENLIGGHDIYYSSQKSKRGLIEFTIYYLDLGAITEGLEITYSISIYNIKGGLISSFRVTSKFDGNGYFSNSWGNFLDKSTFEFYSEHNGQDGELDKKLTQRPSQKLNLMEK